MGWSLGNRTTKTSRVTSIKSSADQYTSTWDTGHEDWGQWEATPPKRLSISAVGYFFGRRLHQILDVPLAIDNLGVGPVAWIPRQAQKTGSSILWISGKNKEKL